MVTGIFAQHAVKGTVVDSKSQETIIGASVVVEGTTIGTTTDFDGNFSLSAPNGNVKLKISYVGYVAVVIPVDNKGVIKVELKENTQNLDEVVVIGYGVQKKSDLTGSVSSIDADEMRSLPTSNVTQAIQGKAAGIEIVSNSGSPGASTSVKIRGTGTVNNSDPLYVVDGIPMDDINFLSSDDVKSIEILKDAASSAIYGSRAANGVVLVTTKSGAEGTKAKINFNMYTGWQESWKNPDVMKRSDFVYFQDYASNTYTITELKDGKLKVRDDKVGVLQGDERWWDVVTRKGMTQKYSVSLSGGTKNMNYYMSANYMNIDGIVNRSQYDRMNVVGKINVKLNKNIDVSLNLNYADESRFVVDESGSYGVVKQALIYNPLEQIINNYGDYSEGTPAEIIRREGYNETKSNFLSQFTLNWKMAEGLNFNTRISETSYNKLSSAFQRSNKSDMTLNDNYYTIRRVPSKVTNFSWDNILSYNKTFNEIHNFSAMVGQTMEMYSYNETSAYGEGYGGYNDNYDALDYGTFNPSVNGYSTGWRSLGFLGRLSYDYKGKYLLQSNFRADASSRFAKNRWGYFPSLSAGWKITGEEFMENVDWLSFLKLRFGWGQLGNNRIGDFVYGTYVKSDGYYVYGDANSTIKQAMSIQQIGNPDITWERTQSTNLGLDFNILNNRLTTSIDVFTKDTKDMLIAVPLNYYLGFSSTPMQNAGSINNKGFEIQLAWKDKTDKFSYEISGNISHIQNKVTSLGLGNEPIYGGDVRELGYVNKTVLNVPIGSFYGWKTAGIIQEGEDISNLATFKTDYAFSPGDMKFVDVNKDGVIDDADKTFLGSPHPSLFYGLSLNCAYAGFDLSMFFQGVYGNKVYNTTKYYLYTANRNYSSVSNVAADYMDVVWRGTPNGDYHSNWAANPTGTVPAPNTNGTINDFNFRNSDFYLEDGSYLRLKNIQLGYNFPKEMCQKIKFESVRLYGSVSNLLTFTKYKGLDPEIGRTSGQESNNLYIGIDQGSYPQARTFTFGLVVDL